MCHWKAVFLLKCGQIIHFSQNNKNICSQHFFYNFFYIFTLSPKLKIEEGSDLVENLNLPNLIYFCNKTSLDKKKEKANTWTAVLRLYFHLSPYLTINFTDLYFEKKKRICSNLRVSTCDII